MAAWGVLAKYLQINGYRDLDGKDMSIPFTLDGLLGGLSKSFQKTAIHEWGGVAA